MRFIQAATISVLCIVELPQVMKRSRSFSPCAASQASTSVARLTARVYQK